MQPHVVRYLACLFLVLSVRAAGDDIDLYAPDPAIDRTYLHLLLDLGNTDEDAVICRMNDNCAPPFTSPRAYAHLQRRYGPGSAVTAPGMFLAVLASVLERPQLNELRVAVSIPNHAGNPRSGDATGLGGATFVQGYLPLGQHRDVLLHTLQSLPLLSTGNRHVMQPRESYLEWLRYLSGGEVALGTNVRGNFGQDDPVPGFDTGIVEDGRYRSPLSAGECPRFYSLAFALGPPGDDNDLDHDLDEEIAAATGLPVGAALADMLASLRDPRRGMPLPGGGRALLRDAWLVTSAAREQDMTAYTRALPAHTMLVDNPVALEQALAARFSYTLRGVDLPYRFTFAPAVGGGIGGEGAGVLQDVFLAQGAASLSPDWPGNLKKLRLVALPGGQATAANPHGDAPLALLDSRGNPALEVGGDRAGLLRPDALTFWTDAEVLPVQPGADHTQETDGARVDRGGAGQKIDGFVAYGTGEGSYSGYFPGDANADPPRDGYPARQVYLPHPGGDGLAPLNADTATAQRLVEASTAVALSPAQALGLARWLRGQDAHAGLKGPRHWLLGQVAHARPVAVNYGAIDGYSAANPRVRLFFGSGEGLFHGVENTLVGGAQAGREVFAFLPPEVVGQAARRYLGAPPSALPGYGPAGQPVTRVVDRNRDGIIDALSGDRAVVYFGLGRGGRSYYALDVSDPAAVPSLLWRITASSGGEFGELGLTFSTPVVGTVDFRGTPEPVLIFAGGYNGGWSPDMTARVGKDVSAADDVVGNAIYIVGADTGELIWKAVHGTTGPVSNTVYGHAGLVDSIPSQVTPLRNASGVIERLYVGDTGGAVWRVDLPGNGDGDENHRRDRWFITRLADLGADAGESGGGPEHDRRFFHAPDVVRSLDGQGAFDGVLIQSGDRAHPNGVGVDDFLFYIKDRHVQAGSDTLRDDDVTEVPGFDDFPDQGECEQGDETVPVAGEELDCADRPLPRGWKLALAEPGEKGVSSPLVDAGRVFFTTFVPGPSTQCQARGGNGRIYVVSLEDGTSAIRGHRFRDLGEGMPDDVQRIAEFLYIPGRPAELYDLDGDGEDDASHFIPSLAGRRYSLYWREPGMDPL